jgi:hypothetical protein
VKRDHVNYDLEETGFLQTTRATWAFGYIEQFSSGSAENTTSAIMPSTVGVL